MIFDFISARLEKDPTVKRHLLKTVSWRLVGSVDTMLLGWLITGRLAVGVSIGGMELLTKMLLYYGHERMWHRLKFGLPTRSKAAEKVRSENKPNLFLQKGNVTREQRQLQNGHPAFTVWLTGLSASGKSTIAYEVDNRLYELGLRSFVVDGDNTRLGINSDLSFSHEDRTENIRRVAEICRLFNNAGTIAIASFISPFRDDRNTARKIIGDAEFIETYVDASLETCRNRDTKGLYRLAEQGKIKEFTGINSPYEPPLSAELHLHTDLRSIEDCVAEVIAYVKQHKLH